MDSVRLEDALAEALKKAGWEIRRPGEVIAWRVGATTVNISQVVRDMMERL